MPLASGDFAGPYTIAGFVGAGGMGEVYRARDPRLNRDVAIKILHASVAGDPERLRRFTAEAQAVAALNHPNVLTIYEVGTHGDHPFIATELLDGETLRTKLDAGALPVSKAVDYARQAAAGLAAAHAKGIAHRDIKPENLFVTSDGRIKILDFGLAKTYGGGVSGRAPTDDTRLESGTSPGVVMGTAGYMSPEQVRARPIDHRTDIFSLGIVLYEMLTGRRPFAGDSAIETMNAILTADPPDIVLSGRTLSPALADIVRHCLEKNPEERFQSARDLAFALQALSAASGATTSQAASGVNGVGTPASPVGRPARRLGLVVAAGVAGLALGAIAMAVLGPGPASDEASGYRFSPIATDAEPESRPVWSPDGRSVAYLEGRHDIYVRTLDADAATPVLTGGPDKSDLFWFPDGTRLGFVTSRMLWAVSRAGGDPERLQQDVVAAAISPDGRTLATWRVTTEGSRQEAGLWFASPIAAPPVPYTGTLGDRQSYQPNLLRYSPDGRRLAYSGWAPEPSLWVMPVTGDTAGPATRVLADVEVSRPPEFSWLPDSRTMAVTYADGRGQSALWLADVDRQVLTRIAGGVDAIHEPSVSPDGRRIAFTAGQDHLDIIEIPLDPAAPLADVLATSRHELAARWTRTGELLYVTNKSDVQEVRLRRLDDGSERVIVGARNFPGEEVGLLSTAELSPDGTRVLFGRLHRARFEQWVAPVGGGSPVKVAAGAESASSAAVPARATPMAVWSPDGREIAYAVASADGVRVLKRRVGSTDEPDVVIDAIANLWGAHMEWSPTGEWIAHDAPEGLSVVSPDGQTRRVLTKTRARAIAWAPGGKTLHAVFGSAPPFTVASVDVASGQVRTIRTLDASVNVISALNPGLRLSLSPDGTRLVTTVLRARTDIWMVER